MKDYRLYILMRTDLPSMGAGRAAAQASHASNAFWHDWGQRAEAKEWARQTPQGFGTAIVLGATKEQIDAIFRSKVDDFNRYLMKSWIIDPDYAISIPSESAQFIDKDKLRRQGGKLEKISDNPEKWILHREEKTCAYIFGDRDDLAPILGSLPLYT